MREDLPASPPGTTTRCPTLAGPAHASTPTAQAPASSREALAFNLFKCLFSMSTLPLC